MYSASSYILKAIKSPTRTNLKTLLLKITKNGRKFTKKPRNNSKTG